MTALLQCGNRLICSANLPLHLQTGLRTGPKRSKAFLHGNGNNSGMLGNFHSGQQVLYGALRLGQRSQLGRCLHRCTNCVSSTAKPILVSRQCGSRLCFQRNYQGSKYGVVTRSLKNICTSRMCHSTKNVQNVVHMLGRHSAIGGNVCRSAVLLGIGIVGGTCLVSLLPKHLQGLCLSCECERLIISGSSLPLPLPIKPSTSVAQKRAVFRTFDRIWRWIRLFLRAVRLNLTFIPLLLLYPFTLLSKRLWHLWLVGLLRAVEFSGPAFVKLGQWAATRRDLFSPSFCDMFSRLHHFACAHSWESTKRTLRATYGKEWRKIFVHFGNKKNPVGSGCIAQVYQAYVPPDSLPADVEVQDFIDDDSMAEVDFAEGVGIENLLGTDLDTDLEGDAGVEELIIGDVAPDKYDLSGLIPVAVKVVHPGVRKTFQRDLTLMYSMAQALEFLMPSLRWLSLSACVAEFASNMRRQLDLRTEARNLEKFHQNFADDPQIRVPKPLMYLSRRDVLVEMYEDATPVGNFIGDSTYSSEVRQRIAELGVDALLKMVFVHNFVHGDLHPGNILVQNAEQVQDSGGAKLVLVDLCDTMVACVQDITPPLRLIFLDCGITVQLKPEDRAKFTAVFAAVVRADGEQVADLFLERSSVVQCSNPDKFRKEMAALVTRFRQSAVSLEKVRVGELLSEVFSLVSRHKIRLESNFASIILAIGVLEGLGRSLYPDMDILERAKPILLSTAVSAAAAAATGS